MRHIIGDLEDELVSLSKKVSWSVRESEGVIGFYASYFDDKHQVKEMRVIKVSGGHVTVRSDYMEKLGLELGLLPPEELLNQVKVMQKGE